RARLPDPRIRRARDGVEFRLDPLYLWAMALPVGSRAPDFELPSQTGELVRLSDLVDKHVVVLYFYPKDETPGCTAQACAFRDDYEVFKKAGAEVVGISSDSVASHRAFAEHHRLGFLILSDAD